MPQPFRFVSLLLRRRQSRQAVVRILRTFDRWKEEQASLPEYLAPAEGSRKKVLVIRLDDIGDWLLFRNHFAVYKQAPRWAVAGHELVLLGNSVWAGLFEALDGDRADRVIWVDKGKYLQDAQYRLELWTRLKREGFSMVVCPSRTRPLLLDDLCALATGAPLRLGSANNFPDRQWNEISDGFFTELFRKGDPLEHEFFFNGAFAEWCCGKRFEGSRPEIGERRTVPAPGGEGEYILCFIGSSTKSKCWPVKNWIAFIQGFVKRHPDKKIIISGGPQDKVLADDIRRATGVDSIAGKVSLTEMIGWVGGAVAIVTNDTMAAHLGVSCNRPTLIIANGNNSLRFTDYARAGIGNVVTVYPRVFVRARNRRPKGSFHHVAVSADIASIGAEVVEGELEGLIRKAAR